MNIIFAGTPDIAAVVFKQLLSSPHHVAAVLTQPDRPAGRGQKMLASPVKALAVAAEIPVYQPASLKDKAIQVLLKNHQADLMVVVAYGLIVPESILQLFPLGCWNIHVSLLPRWRGAAPIQRALEAGDNETGITLMQMDAGLDTGPILLQEKVSISPDMTAELLHDLLADKGAGVLLKGLDLHAAGTLQALPQPKEGATYATKLTKDEARIDWSLPAASIACKIRAFNPWPICYTTYNDQVIRIWAARCPAIGCESITRKIGKIVYLKGDAIGVQTGEGILEILAVQLPAAKSMSMQVFLNGHHDFFIEDSVFI